MEKDVEGGAHKVPHVYPAPSRLPRLFDNVPVHTVPAPKSLPVVPLHQGAIEKRYAVPEPKREWNDVSDGDYDYMEATTVEQTPEARQPLVFNFNMNPSFRDIGQIRGSANVATGHGSNNVDSPRTLTIPDSVEIIDDYGSGSTYETEPTSPSQSKGTKTPVKPISDTVTMTSPPIRPGQPPASTTKSTTATATSTKSTPQVATTTKPALVGKVEKSDVPKLVHGTAPTTSKATKPKKQRAKVPTKWQTEKSDEMIVPSSPSTTSTSATKRATCPCAPEWFKANFSDLMREELRRRVEEVKAKKGKKP